MLAISSVRHLVNQSQIRFEFLWHDLSEQSTVGFSHGYYAPEVSFDGEGRWSVIPPVLAISVSPTVKSMHNTNVTTPRVQSHPLATMHDPKRPTARSAMCFLCPAAVPSASEHIVPRVEHAID